MCRFSSSTEYADFVSCCITNIFIIFIFRSKQDIASSDISHVSLRYTVSFHDISFHVISHMITSVFAPALFADPFIRSASVHKSMISEAMSNKADTVCRDLKILLQIRQGSRQLTLMGSLSHIHIISLYQRPQLPCPPKKNCSISFSELSPLCP